MFNPVEKLSIPDEISQLLANGAHLVVSVSGGKDSDAMLVALATAREVYGWTGRFIALHCDVGRMEWGVSKDHCRNMAERYGAEFVCVKHTKWDLVERIRDRMNKRPDSPPFPSAVARYCTAEFKREVANRWLRQEFPNNAAVVMATGIRAEESRNRARAPIYEFRSAASAPTLNRMVYTWNPIHTFKLNDVWDTLLDGGLDELQQWQAAYAQASEDRRQELVSMWAYHPAYVYGNERVSCAICVLASKNDILNGIEHDPELFRELVNIELESGFSFRQNFWLADLRPDMLSDEQRAQLVACKEDRRIRESVSLELSELETL